MKKKIAICLSGQARTWKKCYQRWIEVFGSQGEIDFYFHFWDYNTLPNLLATHNGGIKIEDDPLTEEEKKEIIETLKPKKFLFESRKPISYWNTTIPISKQFGPWCIEQFYSMYYVSLLKRSFELEKDFRYNTVIRMRSDLWLEDHVTLIDPQPSVLYTTHCSRDETFGVYRVGDIFFYGSSYVYDQASEFYKFLSFVPTDWVTQSDECPPPEIALYFYLTNIGLLNHPTHCSMKVVRDKRVEEIKGKLDNYEKS
jgi:hypothetical protein